MSLRHWRIATGEIELHRLPSPSSLFVCFEHGDSDTSVCVYSCAGYQLYGGSIHVFAVDVNISDSIFVILEEVFLRGNMSIKIFGMYKGKNFATLDEKILLFEENEENE